MLVTAMRKPFCLFDVRKLCIATPSSLLTERPWPEAGGSHLGSWLSQLSNAEVAPCLFASARAGDPDLADLDKRRRAS